MRFKFTKSLPCFFIFFVLKVTVLYFALRFFIFFGETPAPTAEIIPVKQATKLPTKHISKLVTIFIRDFELYENDVTLTAHSFINVFPNIQLFILYDELPYPPLDLMLANSSLSNINFINLSPSLRTSFSQTYPLSLIKTKYVLFVPDSTRLMTKQSVQIMINELNKKPGNIVVAPVNSHRRALTCLSINVSVREWRLMYSTAKGTECDGVSGKHVLLMETETLGKVSSAFLMPFPQSLYMQTSALFVKVKILKLSSFHDGKPVLKSHHAQSKQKRINMERIKKLYSLFKIKQVLKETGSTELYGCTRETSRCFATVLDSTPPYLYEGRWTPPCCLSNLRETARHVFRTFGEAGMRYWLEAGSLLGAMRSADILPWDHDVDVAFIREDLHRCQWLKKAKERAVVDPKGFLWEKATEGNFFRVHFSKANRVHVNLFPFYSKNGTMTRDSWFTSHRNMEFPDNFLHPMSSIDFIGCTVPSPNNIHDFLELKFGKGAIENPEYPDPSKIKFP